eukprot:m.19984 g.19984  ORF g.19984 m.19984 type:complete len:60 (+) comp12000_c0_seq2:59-238(+)
MYPSGPFTRRQSHHKSHTEQPGLAKDMASVAAQCTWDAATGERAHTTQSTSTRHSLCAR